MVARAGSGSIDPDAGAGSEISSIASSGASSTTMLPLREKCPLGLSWIGWLANFIKIAGVTTSAPDLDPEFDSWGGIAGDLAVRGSAGGGIRGSVSGSGETESWPEPSLLLDVPTDKDLPSDIAWDG
jgi:hypothetical protein